MVPVVLTNKCSRQKSQHDFRTGQANEAYKLLERNTVIPVRQRLQDVLRCRVLPAEKPHVGNAQRYESVARLDLADDAERRGLLGSGFIRATAAARAEDNGYSLVLVERPREIGSSCAFVIGMCNHEQDVRFVALDRKSTRLNSSHQIISYAVFCLKKKK